MNPSIKIHFKSPKLGSQRIRNRYNQTFQTSVSNNSLFPLSLEEDTYRDATHLTQGVSFNNAQMEF